jgi:hypothetical protein
LALSVFRLPASMYFLALSQAPPTLLKSSENDVADGADHEEAGH